MRIAILNAYYQQPSFIFRVLEATNHPSNPVNPPSSPIPPSPQDIPSWCRCTHCGEMPSEVGKGVVTRFHGIVTQDYLKVSVFVLQNLHLSLQVVVSSLILINVLHT